MSQWLFLIVKKAIVRKYSDFPGLMVQKNIKYDFPNNSPNADTICYQNPDVIDSRFFISKSCYRNCLKKGHNIIIIKLIHFRFKTKSNLLTGFEVM